MLYGIPTTALGCKVEKKDKAEHLRAEIKMKCSLLKYLDGGLHQEANGIHS